MSHAHDDQRYALKTELVRAINGSSSCESCQAEVVLEVVAELIVQRTASERCARKASRNAVSYLLAHIEDCLSDAAYMAQVRQQQGQMSRIAPTTDQVGHG